MPIWGAVDDLARVITQANEESKFAPHQCEMMMWLLDTLDCIERFPPDEFKVYLKGGTCVQHYLPREKQRFSIDLDFSTCFEDGVEVDERLSVVWSYLQRLKDQLLRDGWSANHGILEIPAIQPGFSAICLSARLFEPIKCRRTSSRVLNIHNAAFVKTEFFLYDTEPEYSNQRLSLVSTEYAVKDVTFNLASRTRLLADKIIALSGQGYGARDENKDILDLKSLCELDGLDLDGTHRMISSWAKSHLDVNGKAHPIEPPIRIVHAARQTALEKSDLSAQVLAQMMGLLYARGREGFNLERSDWKKICVDVVSYLENKILPLFA
ncbi:hypothetical protein D4R54_01295 [archaeon]|nr:MAG: hypothetical protein D4R54_01295 [archaeon]